MLEIVLPSCKKRLHKHKVFLNVIYTHSLGICDRKWTVCESQTNKGQAGYFCYSCIDNATAQNVLD